MDKLHDVARKLGSSRPTRTRRQHPMKRKTLTVEHEIARDVCDALLDGPGCCMSEEGKSLCTTKNCMVYPVVRMTLRILAKRKAIP